MGGDCASCCGGIDGFIVDKHVEPVDLFSTTDMVGANSALCLVAEATTTIGDVIELFVRLLSTDECPVAGLQTFADLSVMTVGGGVVVVVDILALVVVVVESIM